MSKFKVGDRVRAVDETAILVKGREYTVVAPSAIGPAHHVFVNTGSSGVLNYTEDFFELVEPVAVAPATATLKIETGKFYKTRDGRKVGPLIVQDDDEFPFLDDATCESYRPDGTWGFNQKIESRNDLIAEWVDGPDAYAPITVNLDIEFITAPQVGDAVLIPGVISAINQSPRGTNYNIVFETQNRRMSLHFLEEDFILDECGDDEGDCPCANDNGPDPADTAKAFDALGDWLRAVAINPSAAFRSNKEAA